MKDYLLKLASGQEGRNSKLNLMREYLQAYVLRIMHDAGVFRSTAFVGGTALRFLYGLPRFSEDLDFFSSAPPVVDFAGLMKKIKEELMASGYTVAVSYNGRKVVQSAFVKFSGVLFEAGISPFKEQNLSIKIELDTNPPAGAVLRTEIVNKYFPIAFLSYDRASLFAGKVHALLSREYTKGRDFYDLGWYLSKWKDISPNIPFLDNALRQTKWNGAMPAEGSWRDFLREAVKPVDWKKVVEDVRAFLENPSDVDIFTKENVLNLINAAAE